ncbi:glycogen synthase GlgA [Sediminicoccus sp. KRV36]|uniref:glycogen synthase GlgA n=1 Tax=Sediminicoccus sp. KRV36 TaxID=3133721 RepID=UPI00200D2DBC|nr:glycogen synthase GlgA [Sediminicoccus rosea]UPY39360.1 glycogen synthase GlgA [Sediminicoccus rosea]
MRVLAVASEGFPFIKTGGLADVVGALPAALAPEGVAVTTMLPGYPSVMAALGPVQQVESLADLFGAPARLVRAQAAGRDILALDAPHFFARAGSPYLAPGGMDWPDNAMRFAALGRAAAHAAEHLGFDALHAHDWQAGLAPAYLRFAGSAVPTLFTIHNLAFQGQFRADLFGMLGLPAAAFATAGLEYFGQVGYLKSGVWFSDRISTVSPGYAAEIRTPQWGMGLDGLLRGRGRHVSGILNGLDTEEWNPATDPHLPTHYDPTSIAKRALNKAELQARMGLDAEPDAPLFCFIGRLAWQKGVDLILEALPAILNNGAQLAILGSGEAALEERVHGATGAQLGRVGSFIGFDEGLARLCYGGADAILMPSRFEPCGLGQLCALRYGAPPIVARVGGLADTVIDANEMALSAGTGTGLNFAPVSQEMLAAAIERAILLYRDGESWPRIQANAMASDVSWTRSARQYAALFRGMIADRAL